MDKVFGMQKEPYAKPLMYQGVSDTFYPAVAEIPFVSTDDGIDFEGEFGVITDAVPMNASRAEAARHIRLIVQINDWSLRKLAPVEMKTGSAGCRPSRLRHGARRRHAGRTRGRIGATAASTCPSTSNGTASNSAPQAAIR